MSRAIVDVAVIIPDASPVLTLARVGRVDLLGHFTTPIKIVDQVHYEITKPQNDPTGEVGAGARDHAARGGRRPVRRHHPADSAAPADAQREHPGVA